VKTNGSLDINNECLRKYLDLIKEFRQKAKVREKAVKQRACKRFNVKVKSRVFNEGDLV